MRTILTASLVALGLTVSTVEAGYPNQANLYATAVDREAHHLDEDLHKAFPHYAGLLQKGHRFTALAHTTEKLVLNRSNLAQAEYNVRLMQRTLSSIDRDLHSIADHQPYHQRLRTLHILKVVHRLDSYLETLENEVQKLNRFVILPHPGHGHRHPHHHRKDHVVIRPQGVHIRKGGFSLNLPF